MLAPKFIPLVLKQVDPPPHADAAHRRRRRDGDVPVLRGAGDAGRRRGGDADDRAPTRRWSSTARTASAPRPAGCRSTTRERIAKVPGVASVVPMKIDVTNCRTSLDVVTFRGVPPEAFATAYAPSLTVRRRLARRVASPHRRGAARRDAGQPPRARASATGSTRSASTSTSPASSARTSRRTRTSAYVHLPFLQRSTGAKQARRRHAVQREGGRPGAARSGRRGDRRRVRAATPSRRSTSPEKAFVARAAADVVRDRRLHALARLGLPGGGAGAGRQRDRAVACRTASASTRCSRRSATRGGLIARLIVAEGLAARPARRRCSGTVGACALLQCGQLQPVDEGLEHPDRRPARASLLIGLLIVGAARRRRRAGAGVAGVAAGDHGVVPGGVTP